MALFTENYKSAQVGFGYDSVGRLASLTRTAKAANPAAHVADWITRNPQAQQCLINYWLKEAQTYSEQAAILQGLLGGGG